MEEVAPNQKNKKNPSYPTPDGLKPKAINWKKSAKSKKQKKSIIAKLNGLKPKTIKLKNKPQIKNQRKPS